MKKLLLLLLCVPLLFSCGEKEKETKEEDVNEKTTEFGQEKISACECLDKKTKMFEVVIERQEMTIKSQEKYRKMSKK